MKEQEEVIDLIRRMNDKAEYVLSKIENIDSFYPQLISDYKLSFDVFRTFMKDVKEDNLKRFELAWRMVYGITGLLVGTFLGPLFEKFLGGG